MTEILDNLRGISDETRKTLEEQYSRDVAQAIAERHIDTLFPANGPLRRELYPKIMTFFREGKNHQERAIIAANRVGKTTAAAYELTLHLTGEYPEWWQGRRFGRPVTAWACGEDAKAVRETIQVILLGQPGRLGTGMIPKSTILNTTSRSGVADAIDTVTVRHATGGQSRLVLKSYDQGRESYQGAKVDVVWYDEEPDLGIYNEGLTRTMSTVPGEQSGLVFSTFTPLKGLSAVVLGFMPGGQAIEGIVPAHIPEQHA